ncbi:MAG: hypothetical protein ABII21_01255 [bacterium]
MPKKKLKLKSRFKPKSKSLVVGLVSLLVLVVGGIFLYRSLSTPADINMISDW